MLQDDSWKIGHELLSVEVEGWLIIQFLYSFEIFHNIMFFKNVWQDNDTKDVEQWKPSFTAGEIVKCKLDNYFISSSKTEDRHVL